LNPGQYDKRITLQTVDDTTEQISDLATVWAKVRAISGHRALIFQQLVMGVWYDIETPYRADLTTLVPGDPIKLGTETLTVHQIIDPDETKREWHIKAYVKRG